MRNLTIGKNEINTVKQFVDRALSNGWLPTNLPIQDTHVVYDPFCVVVSVSSPSQLIDNNIYLDWLSPLSERDLAAYAWGEHLYMNEVAWRYHQHRLLDFLQNNETLAYFEYLDTM